MSPLYHSLRLLLAALLLTSCATVQDTRQLDRLKQSYQAGDYQSVAAETLDCQGGEGCNQQHLLKGNACLILAPQAAGQEEATERYRCAADHLREGIRLTERTGDWRLGELDLNRPASYENLAQALQELSDDLAGQQRLGLIRELENTALQLRTLQPDAVAGVYYLNSARLGLLLAQMARGNVPPDACSRLQASEGELRNFEPAAAASPRYQEPYRQLQVDVFSARRAVPGCGA